MIRMLESRDERQGLVGKKIGGEWPDGEGVFPLGGTSRGISLPGRKLSEAAKD